ELCRIVGNREVNLKDASITDNSRIEIDPNRFGMASGPRANPCVVSGCLVAARVSRNRAGDALDMLKHPLDAPKASASKNGDLGRATSPKGLLECWRGYYSRILFGGY